MQQGLIQPINTDFLNLQNQSKLTTLLESNEIVKLSTNINKYNYNKKCQQRILVVTNTSILNIEKTQNLFKSLMKKFINFQHKYTIKRRIPIVSLYGITITSNRNSGVFLIQVQQEYDYYYEAHGNKMTILKIISQSYKKLTKNQLPFYIKDQSIIANYVTTKANIKQKKDLKPKQSPIFLNDQYFFERKFEDEYICEYSCDNRKAEPKNFKRVDMKEIDEQKDYYILHQQYDRSINVQTMYKSKSLITPSYSFYSNKKQILFTLFMSKGNIKNYFHQIIPLNQENILFYIPQIVNFLISLHQAGKIYGNLTLQNILVKKNGYLIYNGLVKSIQDISNGKKIYKIYGNPYYFSPEVITCKGFSFSSDIWRLGIIYFYLYKGYFPFQGKSLKELYFNILNSKLQQDTPVLIQRMLCKEPTQRISLAEIKDSSQMLSVNWIELQKEKIKKPNQNVVWHGKMPIVYQLLRINQ